MQRRVSALFALIAALVLFAPPMYAGGLTSTPIAPLASPARLSTGLARDLATLAPDAPYTAFVSVTEGADAAGLLAGSGVTVLRNYPLVSAAYVSGPVTAIGALAAKPGVVYLEDNRTLALHGDTGTWATRVRVAQEPVAGGMYTDAAGHRLTGENVGVAVVDSGINAAHPDLTSRVAKNYKYVCTTPGLISTVTETCFGNYTVDDINGTPHTTGWVELPPGTTSDTDSGHGTHVAGIIAGKGIASQGAYTPGAAPKTKGTFTGVAPNAKLYGYGIGAVISVLFATEAHYHILETHDSVTPPIRVVNNSWGETGGATGDPASIAFRLNDELVAAGVTMVYSAGNNGGDGSADITNSNCDNPTPGILCVANYDDADTGGRDLLLSADSSRGKIADSNTWPDIAAPGTFITAACVRQVQPICMTGYVDEVRYAPYYATISGTSMAAPHIAGAVAMLLQARPNLTPAQIEDILTDTAHKFSAGAPYVADPQNANGTTSYDKGAGLLDMKAALDSLGVSHGTATAPNKYVIFAGDGTTDVVAPPFGAGNIDSLRVTQTTVAGVPGIRYDAALVDASDIPPNDLVQLRLFQNVGGVAYTVNVNLTAAGVAAAAATPATATAENVTLAGNVVSFFLPFSKLGNPVAGEPFQSVQLVAYVGTAVDIGPGTLPALVHLFEQPMYGRPFARV